MPQLILHSVPEAMRRLLLALRQAASAPDPAAEIVRCVVYASARRVLRYVRPQRAVAGKTRRLLNEPFSGRGGMDRQHPLERRCPSLPCSIGNYVENPDASFPPDIAPSHGSHNEYLYLKCSAPLGRKCENRARHRYQPIETVVQELLADIANGDPPTADEQIGLRARIAHAKAEAAEIETQLAAQKRKHSAMLAEIANFEARLQSQMQVGEQAKTIRRLIARLHRLPVEARLAIRERINAGLRRLLRGGVLIAPNGDIRICFSPSEAPGPHREIHLASAVPDGAVLLETAEQVLAAIKAGHRVGAAPSARPDHDPG